MKTIVIAGGGAAGLQLAIGLGRRLGRSKKARVILVDRSPTHLWKPLLHEVAAGRVEPSTHHTSFALQAGRNHFEFVLGELVALDRAGRTVTVATGGTGQDCAAAPRHKIPYDKLVLAVGGVTQYFNVPGSREHALALDSVDCAEQVRDRLHAALRRASAPPGKSAKVRVLIVGAGATGVQLAAQLRHASGVLNRYGVHTLDPVHDVSISLVEASGAILPGLAHELGARVARQLGTLGIGMVTGRKVTSVDADGLMLDGTEHLPADLVVWAAGVAAPASVATFGLSLNAKGQVRVGATLQSIDDEHVFAIGDCAGFRPANAAHELPTRAQVAWQQQLYLAIALSARLRGKRMRPFEYREFGSLISLAAGRAVGSLGAARGASTWYVEGFLAALMHQAVYRRHLLGINGWARAVIVAVFHGLGRLLGTGVRLH